MGTTTEQIEAHIEHTREALGSNLDELEQRVTAATDWRHHFQAKPMTLLGVAFGGGVVLSKVLGRRNKLSEKRPISNSGASAAPGAEPAHRKEVVARQTWDNVKGAILAVATTRLLHYASEAFLGVPRKAESREQHGGIISPEGEQS